MTAMSSDNRRIVQGLFGICRIHCTRKTNEPLLGVYLVEFNQLISQLRLLQWSKTTTTLGQLERVS